MSKKHGLDILKRDVEIPEVVQKRAQDAFDQIHREALTKEDGVALISERKRDPQTIVGTMKKGTGRKRTKRTVAVIILTAVLMLGTLTIAVAAYRGSLTEGLKKMFHISQEQEEDLVNRDDLVYIIESTDNTTESPTEEAQGNEKETMASGDVLRETIEGTKETEGLKKAETDVTSVSRQGVTVTLTQAIVDQHFAAFSLRVEGLPEAECEDITFNRTKFYINDEFAGSVGGGVKHAENGIQELAFSVRVTRGETDPGWFIGEELKIVFTDLALWDENWNREVIMEDVWELTWTIQGTEDLVVLEMWTELGDTGATVTSVRLSPISAVVKYDFARKTQQEEDINGDAFIVVAEPPHLKGVILKDGTVYENVTSQTNQNYLEGSTQEYITAQRFEYIFEPDEIASLLFRKADAPDQSEVLEDKYYIVPLYQ